MSTNLNINTNTVKRRLRFPRVLLDGNTVGWYDSQLLSTITKDGSDLVSRWNDRLGSGHDLLQAVGTNQPLYNTNGILFDGVDNFMSASFTLTQPTFIYMVIKQMTWVNTKRLFDGITVNSYLRQETASPNLRMAAGALGPQSTGLGINTYGIIRVLFNGISSKFTINELTPVVGDAGTNDMGGITIGARGDGTDLYSNIEVKEIIIRKVADAAQDEADIYSYLSTKYGI